MGELASVPSVSIGGEDLRGHGYAGAGESESFSISAHADFGIVAGRCDRMRRTSRDVDCIDGLLGLIFSDKIDSAAIGRPERFLHTAVELFGEIGDLLCCPIVKHEAPAIALIAGNRLRVISDRTAIGRINRMTVETRI